MNLLKNVAGVDVEENIYYDEVICGAVDRIEIVLTEAIHLVLSTQYVGFFGIDRILRIDFLLVHFLEICEAVGRANKDIVRDIFSYGVPQNKINESGG